MNAKKNLRIPSLRHCNNRGFVELNGRRYYLGPWGAPETQEAYDRKISEWLANRKIDTVPVDSITITELIRDYWHHCEDYYRRPDGTHTSSLGCVRQACKPLQRLYGASLVEEFGPLALRGVRDEWVNRGLSRKTVNDYTATIRNLFKWGASHEKVDVGVYQALTTVANLKKGRSQAKESKPVCSVPDAHIQPVEPHVSCEIWALINLQLLTGARPGELLKLRPCDLNVENVNGRVKVKQVAV